ncbi:MULTISPECIES: MarR family transcriptional regulator [Kitasatospora]|uniref:Putative MarR family transcriptional regulator n=1 Tax=Kitasatospora setae (strain ATCC 33774 / DSM 43861 / JCM 3304 / KCC A-0304 / NBRC 14216 / KM-6054) TaxID=452652 RepID=E4N0W8_KITSK|nr:MULTISPECIES: MarR family transcriptional regulator [Kitasatospora]BAJ31802.1 putative MarR family transcriptional regulator [Kitasatospora setae KM-6054]
MTEPRWLDDTEMRAWAGLLETYDLIHRQVELQLREAAGLTMVQYEILTRLNESPDGACGMTELAERMVASRSGLTYQVGQLAKAGLLVREPDPADERAVLAVITAEGKDLLESAAPGHVRVVREGLLDLYTPEQTAQLAALMDTARAHLRRVVPVIPPRPRRKRE